MKPKALDCCENRGFSRQMAPPPALQEPQCLQQSRAFGFICTGWKSGKYLTVLACVASFLMATITLAADGTGSIETDVCVVGGGSGGVSAALAAARAGARVVSSSTREAVSFTSAFTSKLSRLPSRAMAATFMPMLLSPGLLV